MVDVGIIEGSPASAKPVIFTGNTVYVHTDIKVIKKPINPDDPDSPEYETYQYHEYRYGRDEYDALLGDTLLGYDGKIDELTSQLTDDEIALTDMEIENAELKDQLSDDEIALTDLEITVAELEERIGEA